MGSLTTRVIRTLDELDELALVWDPLLERSANTSLFLSWGWVLTWSRIYLTGSELFVIVITDGAEPVAIALLWKERSHTARLIPVRTLRFLGSGEACSDYFDLIVQEAIRGGCREFDFLRGDEPTSFAGPALIDEISSCECSTSTPGVLHASLPDRSLRVPSSMPRVYLDSSGTRDRTHHSQSRPVRRAFTSRMPGADTKCLMN